MILLTYAALSGVASRANVVLICSVHGTAVFDSYVAVMSIVNYLGTEPVTHARSVSRKRMQRIRNVHEPLDELDEQTTFHGKKNVFSAFNCH